MMSFFAQVLGQNCNVNSCLTSIPAGCYLSPAKQTCLSCPAGSTSLGGSASVCTCAAGFYQAGSGDTLTCTPCPSGSNNGAGYLTTSVAGSSSCLCPSQTSSSALVPVYYPTMPTPVVEACIPQCPTPGTYVNSGTGGGCLTCPATGGLTTSPPANNNGPASCFCMDGYAQIAATVVGGAPTCNICAAGTYAAAGASFCTTVSPGYFASIGTTY